MTWGKPSCPLVTVWSVNSVLPSAAAEDWLDSFLWLTLRFWSPPQDISCKWEIIIRQALRVRTDISYLPFGSKLNMTDSTDMNTVEQTSNITWWSSMIKFIWKTNKVNWNIIQYSNYTFYNKTLLIIIKYFYDISSVGVEHEHSCLTCRVHSRLCLCWCGTAARQVQSDQPGSTAATWLVSLKDDFQHRYDNTDEKYQ